ncbi:valine--tRNA ligase [Enterobacteriaceae endosymbiont of Macroplea mutica]|uniref:valine--tRNA ligase n=1 Tax=Enterobacteriaceae endosymbiont of Macroplea mutica TaxID=2675791 RepID=UPI00144A2793|nr:valine--tRNA ligase [Enterobacteriaceae endosymbiont of Macroplea mutica]QJC31188.1 valine--tRNA ligase [Enterobacteriaceae endosymbiont of Macroplea mutica]
MDKIYNPNSFEKKIYVFWEKNKFFQQKINLSKKHFSIMVPPPNITGFLHMGHALQYSIIDIIIRYQRMLQKNILCQVGIDHAGIATQNLIEQEILLNTGKTKQHYNKKYFLEKAKLWKNKYSDIIIKQMKRLGLSANWDNIRFTMDEHFSQSVTNIFITLYKAGLIYQKERLIHWDTTLQTVISDLEVEHRSMKTNIWHLKYLLHNKLTTINDKNYLVIATTRPETLLADTAIAVNPQDERYKHLVGKYVLVPIINRKIPIISDNHAKISKGTGCVKISPAHDFDDYKIAVKHNLPVIKLFDKQGHILDRYQIFTILGHPINSNDEPIPSILRNIHYLKARNIIIKLLKQKKLLKGHYTEYRLIPYNMRNNTVILPMLTKQWYLNVKNLAKQAIHAIKTKQIEFIPTKYENMFFSWMYNIQDWCISRQLWWGHRLPVWYDCDHNIYVGQNITDIKKQYFLQDDIILKQDTDVLDTWFSSSLWTFITLGWPDNKQYMKLFHPTNIIVSGFDIIFFWIARMIMMTMYFVKDHDIAQVPFKKVLMTGLVRDSQGNKMSKSKGNIIDPINLMESNNIFYGNKIKQNCINNIQGKCINIQNNKKLHSYGADAIRFTLAALSVTGRDIYWDITRLDGYRNFCNKIWNASIFIFKHINYELIYYKSALSIADQWIISEYNTLVLVYTKALKKYRFDTAANLLYNFIWNKFCDWYLEYVKYFLQTIKNNIQHSTHYTMYYVFESLLRLSHPMLPFITEVIWQKIQYQKDDIDQYSTSILVQSFPKYNTLDIHNKAVYIFRFFIKLISVIRQNKIDMNIKQPVDLYIFNIHKKIQDFIKVNLNIIKKILNLQNIILLASDASLPNKSFTFCIEEIIFAIPLNSFLIDKKFLIQQLKKKISNNQKIIDKISNNIKNHDFINKAPKKIIEEYNIKLSFCRQKKKELNDKYNFIKHI